MNEDRWILNLALPPASCVILGRSLIPISVLIFVLTCKIRLGVLLPPKVVVRLC